MIPQNKIDLKIHNFSIYLISNTKKGIKGWIHWTKSKCLVFCPALEGTPTLSAHQKYPHNYFLDYSNLIIQMKENKAGVKFYNERTNS